MLFLVVLFAFALTSSGAAKRGRKGHKPDRERSVQRASAQTQGEGVGLGQLDELTSLQTLQISFLLELEAAVQSLGPVPVGTSEASSSTEPAPLHLDDRQELLADIRRWRMLLEIENHEEPVQPMASQADIGTQTNTSGAMQLQLQHLLNVEALAGMGSLAWNDTQDVGCQVGDR